MLSQLIDFFQARKSVFPGYCTVIVKNKKSYRNGTIQQCHVCRIGAHWWCQVLHIGTNQAGASTYIVQNTNIQNTYKLIYSFNRTLYIFRMFGKFYLCYQILLASDFRHRHSDYNSYLCGCTHCSIQINFSVQISGWNLGIFVQPLEQIFVQPLYKSLYNLRLQTLSRQEKQYTIPYQKELV